MAESDVAAVTTEVAATFYGLQGAAVQSAATLLEEKRA
jgi:hypothetical protein